MTTPPGNAGETSLPYRPNTTVTANAEPKSLYAQQYFEAVDLYEQEQFDKCLELLRYNLTDPTLPRYFIIKSHMLITGVEDNWYVSTLALSTLIMR